MERQEVLQLIERTRAENSTELDLGNKGLTEIPPEIFQLSNLQTLDLGENKITKIPDEIAALSNLQQLNLAHNQITKIPDVIASLCNLQELYLYNNQITEITNAITSLSNLQELYLFGNQITKIPDEIATLSSLQNLWLSVNQITKIPDEIAALSNLQQLYLGNNQITEIPDEIAALSNLQQLYLAHNQITEIPDAITALSQLQKLDLDYNQITKIPDAISAIHNLQFLSLGKNQITEIPDAITQLVNLKLLVLKDNPITNVPPEIIRKVWGKDIGDDGDPQVIFSYLKAYKRPLNEIKVLLVGEGDVGKTSLLNRLLYDTFNSEECKTPGINIAQWHLPEKPNIRLNLWDFGGQKVMHATHQFFLTKRSLYLLVIDNRKNEQQNRVEYWLKLIKIYGGDSPVIIVGNCADEDFPHVKIRTLKKKYPQIVLPEKDNPFSQNSVIATSCKTGEGIEALRQEIARQIETIPHIKDLLPVSWFEIKTKLEKMQKDYDFISYEKYQEYCQNTDIISQQDQKTLVEFLHDLGIVLNYQDDPRLKETNVLNPEWVTSGVYDILNNNELVIVQRKCNSY
jgi:internalin A